MCTDLGLTILEDIQGYNEKTALIAAPGCSSVKLMAALSTTKHIVTSQWLLACHDAKHLVSTSSYAANHAEAINNGEHFRASGDHILSGMFVHRVIGTNGIKYNKPTLEELRDLVEVSGGEWVLTQRKAGNSHAPKLLVLMDDNDFDKPKQTKYIQELLDKGATKIRWSDLKNCLLLQSLEPVLSEKATKPEPRSQTFKERLNTLLTSPKTLKTLFTPPQMRNTPINENGDDTGENNESLSDHGLEGGEVLNTPKYEGDTSADVFEAQSSVSGRETPGTILLYSTKLKHFNRNLSIAGGVENRGEIGAGMMNISKSKSTGMISVHVLNGGGLKFQAEVPSDFSGIFGNAGRENTLGWDAYDTSGNIKPATAVKDRNAKNEAMARRFFFHFDTREHLTCVLFVLFGGDDNARGLVEEFFDSNGRFCPNEEPALPHRVFDPNRMDIDSVNGLSPPTVQTSAPTSRVLFDNDPCEYSQLI